MEENGLSAFRLNFLFLFSIIGVLYIAFLSLYMVALSLKRRKVVIREETQKTFYNHLETGASYEEVHLQKATYEISKKGTGFQHNLNQIDIVKVVPDETVHIADERAKLKSTTGKKALRKDNRGRVIGLDETVFNVTEERRSLAALRTSAGQAGPAMGSGSVAEKGRDEPKKNSSPPPGEGSAAKEPENKNSLTPKVPPEKGAQIPEPLQGSQAGKTDSENAVIDPALKQKSPTLGVKSDGSFVDLTGMADETGAVKGVSSKGSSGGEITYQNTF